ncbi:MAG TPA: exosome complex RNA-binding protein Rrp4 [Candidatus Woesearchaeota archaeon]|nr:exosome complex RNA-binding protein Rrp4 [Candidatus Woesearchaeota archaeon]
MSEIKVENKQVVIPGEELASGLDFVPSGAAFRENEKIFSKRVGLTSIDGRVIKVIPLAGAYVPNTNDVIIGKISDILLSGWRINLFSAYDGVLNIKDAVNEFIRKGEDLTKFFEIGDWVVTKVTNVTSQKLVDLSTRGPGLRKLDQGRILRVSPYKVPRIIGKQGSMVNMIKDNTNTQITVGQNGVIWISGEPEMEVVVGELIKTIEENSHTSGLTERVKGLLEKKLGKEIKV